MDAPDDREQSGSKHVGAEEEREPGCADAVLAAVDTSFIGVREVDGSRPAALGPSVRRFQPSTWVSDELGISHTVDVPHRYNVAHRGAEAVICSLDAQGISSAPFWPLGDFSSLQSGTLDAVAERPGTTPQSVAITRLLHRAPTSS